MGLTAMMADDPVEFSEAVKAVLASRAIPRAAPVRNIPIITDTALSIPATPLRRPQKAGEPFKPLDQRERDDAMSVALAQPHRRGFDDQDRRPSTAPGRFCLARRLRAELLQAAEHYARLVGDERLARGFEVVGREPPDEGLPILTAEQIAARKELAIDRLRQADQELLAITPRLPRAMFRFCVDDRDPAPNDEEIIEHGLVKIAISNGLLKTFHNFKTGD